MSIEYILLCANRLYDRGYPVARILKIAGKLRTVLRLPFREVVWIAFIYPLSALFRLAVLLIPFRVLARFMGTHLRQQEPSPLASETQLLLAWRIGLICRLAARYTPWKSKCLVQAMMTRTLLGYYHIPYVIHLGVMKADQGRASIQAHAWVKVGRLVVSGRESHKPFTVLASYISPSRLPPAGKTDASYG